MFDFLNFGQGIVLINGESYKLAKNVFRFKNPPNNKAVYLPYNF